MPQFQNLSEFYNNRPLCLISLSEIADVNCRLLVERFATDSCSHMACPDNTILCKVLGKYLMWVDANDESLSPHLVLQGYWEIWVTQALAQHAKPNSIALDIGANVGYFTMLMADAVGEHGKVYAFEPNKRLAKMVKKSANINGFGNRINVANLALSDRENTAVEFAIPKADPKNAGLITTEHTRQSFEDQHDEIEFVTCAQTSLDAFNYSNVGVAKIDVEGAEYGVWCGMKQTIQRSQNIAIVMEVNAQRGYDINIFYDEMLTLFNEVRHVDFDGGIKPLTKAMISTERRGHDWMVFLSNSR
jgi:FkbM family methyltransferase